VLNAAGTHVEIHESCCRHFVRQRDNSLDQKQLCRFAHRTPACLQDGDRFVTIVNHHPHQVGIAAFRYRFEKLPAYSATSRSASRCPGANNHLWESAQTFAHRSKRPATVDRARQRGFASAAPILPPITAVPISAVGTVHCYICPDISKTHPNGWGQSAEDALRILMGCVSTYQTLTYNLT
jgi:hypothetical protein